MSNIYGPGDDDYGRNPAPWKKNDMKVEEPNIDRLPEGVIEHVNNLTEDLRSAVANHSDAEARPVIDRWLKDNLVMLRVHSRSWYYNNI